MPDIASADLLDLLAQERAAILEGRYDALAAIGVAKQGALDAALAAWPNGPVMARGLAAFRHNQNLLAAALSGLRGAAQGANRLAGFMAYCKDGHRAMIGPVPPGFDRQA